MTVAPLPIPEGKTAVMANRGTSRDNAVDYFPTPPWATRALFVHVLRHVGFASYHEFSAWEPACGGGHMSAVLEEYCAPVIATDIIDYSGGDPGKWPAGWWRTQDFLDEFAETPAVDWIITNPPFITAAAFAERALELAHTGVALLVRTQWIEGRDRYERLFRDRPPTIFAPFCERVPMVVGRWDPNASTATSYAWFVWVKGQPPRPPVWIPPGCRKSLSHPDDIERFARKAAPEPLLEGSE